MTSSTDEKDEGRELEARVVVVEGVEKQVSGGLCDNFAEEEEKVVTQMAVFIFIFSKLHHLSPDIKTNVPTQCLG